MNEAYEKVKGFSGGRLFITSGIDGMYEKMKDDWWMFEQMNRIRRWRMIDEMYKK